MKTIAIVNQKGGVAKTTTTFNLATCLAAANKNVLMVDLDPQASLTISAGIAPESYGSENVCQLFQRRMKTADYAITVDSTAPFPVTGCISSHPTSTWPPRRWIYFPALPASVC